MRFRNALRPYYPIRDRALRWWATRYVRGLDIPRGDQAEQRPHYIDLALLHRAIMKRRPKVVLEFGIGFSTLVVGDACRKVGRRSTRWMPTNVGSATRKRSSTASR